MTFSRSSYSSPVDLIINGEDTDTIEYVEISSNASPRITNIFITGYDPGTDVGAVERIEEVSGSGLTNISELRIDGNLGDGGNDEDCVIVDAIDVATIGGDVTDGVYASSGTIDDMTVLGNFLGDLTCNQSSLISLVVTGAVGSPGTPVTITVDDDVRALEAAEIHANITADRYIHRVAALTGDLTGSLAGDYLYPHNTIATDGIHVAGDMDADLTQTDDIQVPIVVGGELNGTITADSLTAGNDGADTHGTITIGDKLNGDLVVTDNGGLDEQVIINADNNVYTTWTDAWVGDVIVDGTTVAAGAYPDTDLGDGAVGLARFTLHREACDPPEGSTLDAGDAPTIVKLVHYGPYLLYPDVTNKPHVRIDRRYIGSNPPGPWSLVGGSYSVDTGASTDRLLAIKKSAGGDWDAGYEYRIRHDPPSGMVDPIYGYLKCDQVSTNPALRMYTDSPGGYEYILTINP